MAEQYSEESVEQEEMMAPQYPTEQLEPNQMGGKEFYCDISSSCDCNEVCDQSWEDIYTCDDCIRFAQCGDGLCEPLVGEDDPSSGNYCSTDCNTDSDNDVEEIEIDNEIAGSNNDLEEIVIDNVIV